MLSHNYGPHDISDSWKNRFDVVTSTRIMNWWIVGDGENVGIYDNLTDTMIIPVGNEYERIGITDDPLVFTASRSGIDGTIVVTM